MAVNLVKVGYFWYYRLHMLKIRLQRIGRRNNPAFRVVVTESTRGPKSGNNIELLGSYNPHSKMVTLNADRILHWIKNGAQVSDTVHNILINEKIIQGTKKNVLPRKSPIVKESSEEVAESNPTEEGVSGNESAPVAVKDTDVPPEAEAPSKEDSSLSEGQAEEKSGTPVV
ncbi:MAG TPA: 30S ribosomal protein S16 [Candidatus Paceibacterota bacterium]